MVAHTHKQGPQPKGKRGVRFNYRSAHGIHGEVTGVFKKGKTHASTEFDVMPDKQDRHPGEKLPIHRRGDKLH